MSCGLLEQPSMWGMFTAGARLLGHLGRKTERMVRSRAGYAAFSQNPEVVALANDYEKEVDTVQRLAKLEKIRDWLYKDWTIIPLFEGSRVWAYNTEVLDTGSQRKRTCMEILIIFAVQRP